MLPIPIKFRMKRPVLVSIIGWLIVLEGILGLAGITFALGVHVYRPGSTVALAYLTNAVLVIAAIGVLRGHQWARIVYLAVATIVRTVELFTLPLNNGDLFWGGCLLVSAVMLFLPQSNAYFRRSEGSAAIS